MGIQKHFGPPQECSPRSSLFIFTNIPPVSSWCLPFAKSDQEPIVRTLRIEKSTSKEPVDFEQWIERDLVHTDGQLQNEEILVRDGHATYLRFIIMSAFDHFASVHSVSAEGVAVSGLS
ncbi:intraflagellar transport protein 25 homolog isoform X3 [Talpa occidentalis]|uniref:intraflagellar transport protein 25 homolog isoform X3 n=1 Tax=Talpa occidentalis TaxID=50954 RepID=UPI0023F7682D|nr:intraflagellar transport protein 25 homolog isoform X3 [Talpa occidentalis]